MKIAVVTGASSGMGREFVYALDRQQKFDEIWVLARREGRLQELKSRTRARIRPLPCDLLKRESISAYETLLKKEQPTVAVLVNAAGFGLFGTFEKMSMDEQLDIIGLNDQALTAMTYVTLPFMKKSGKIYNMGSLSSFQPVPYINVYGASKAYVLSFSQALGQELRPRGIRVIAVCPGWVSTEFFDRAVTDDTISYYNRYYPPEQVVKKALLDMKLGKAVSVLGVPERLQVGLVKHSPASFIMRAWCKQQNQP